ncbi:MAG: MFS transporter [Pseudomonadota bacterium]
MSNTTPASESRLSRDELRFIGRLSTVSISRMFGLFMVLPVLALWADDFANATPLLVGIAVGGYGVTQAMLQIPYGALSDRVGRPVVIVFGLTVFLIGSVLAATASGIWGVIIGRLLQGAGAVSATLSAWLADRTRPTVRTPAMAIFGASIGASFLLALVFGPLVSAVTGVRGVFWVSAALGGLGVALVLPDLFKRDAAQPVLEKRPEWDWRVLTRSDLLALDFAILILHALLTAFFVLAPYLLADRLGFPEDHLSKVYAITLALSLPIAIPMIALDRRGTSRFSSSALALIFGGLMLLWLSSSVLVFAGGCCLFFAGFSYLEASLPAEMSRRADPGQRGACLGLFSSAQFFGAFVGATLAGAFLDSAGAEVGIIALAGIVGLWLITAGVKSLRSGA